MSENRKETEYKEYDQPLGKTAQKMQKRVIFAPEGLGEVTEEGFEYFWEKYALFDLVMESYDLGFRAALKGADIDETEAQMAQDWKAVITEALKENGMLYTGEKDK